MGVELIQELVETTLLTGRVWNAAPVSLLLIAPPEAGKTSIVLAPNSSNALVLTDVTGKALQQLCTMQPQISHFILTDMITVMAHREVVVKYTLTMLNAMTEEGIKRVAFPGAVEQFEFGRRGIIACLTQPLVTDRRNWWNKTGFASRMLPFNYDYSERLTIRIKEAIQLGREDIEAPSKGFRVPTIAIKVGIGSNAARALRRLADHTGRRLAEKGFRRQKQFRTLARAHALRRQWREAKVEQEDISFLARVEPFMSYTQARPL